MGDVATEEGGCSYLEVQRFDQLWLRMLMGVILLASVGAFVAVLTGIDDDAPTGALGWLGLSVAAIALPVGLNVWMFWMHLQTEVHPQGVRLRFRGLFVDRRIEWPEIEGFQAVSYRPIREYGGWGVRGLSGKRAYNVKGDRGVLVWLSGGRTVLIGSQRSEALEAALASASGRRPGPPEA